MPRRDNERRAGPDVVLRVWRLTLRVAEQRLVFWSRPIRLVRCGERGEPARLRWCQRCSRMRSAGLRLRLRLARVRCADFSLRRCLIRVLAAFIPGMPLMPAIGWVPEPDRYRPGIGVL